MKMKLGMGLVHTLIIMEILVLLCALHLSEYFKALKSVLSDESHSLMLNLKYICTLFGLMIFSYTQQFSDGNHAQLYRSAFSYCCIIVTPKLVL